MTEEDDDLKSGLGCLLVLILAPFIGYAILILSMGVVMVLLAVAEKMIS